MKKTVFALIAAAFAFSAHAAEPGTAYVGVGVATVDHNADIAGASNMGSTGYKASGKIFGGYNFDKNVALEAGYTDFAKSTYNYTAGTASKFAESDGHAFYVAGKYSVPVNDTVNVYGKLGLTRVKNSVSGALNTSDSNTRAYGGLGAEFALNKQVALNLEYERYGTKTAVGAKPDVWSAGVKFAF
ncbi:outer membrane beta-barrel protein [Massilia sp. TS11]|uniref:outer membrane beta-barrel protein n=1 Tax=Massilia sp. TS11 TaxID=2908003 RepID=UPI001EDC91BB|nr:outer membrane beta-barrel protein [Massilia sp. TS11]MCG2585292.1 porin family protein [Massilia sp. TS11]